LAFLESSVGSKLLVAVTGLSLVTFAVFHMIGNLKVFQGQQAINDYAYFLKHSMGALIWIARAGLLVVFALHITLAIRLKWRAVAARPVPYQYPGSVQATVSSRTMIWTGVVVGLFLVYHLAHYTFAIVGGVEVSPGKVVNFHDLADGSGRVDVYSMVVAGFSNPLVAGLYIVAQVVLFIHLLHGIQSSFQTLGLKNRRFSKAIKTLGIAVALTILVGNLAIVVGVLTGTVPPLYPKV